MTNLRLIAARIINQVTEGASLSDVLEPAVSALKDHRDRAFVQAICYGVCRFYSRLDLKLSRLLTKPMKEKDSDIHALLLVGLYQLSDMRVPPHAAVAETVAAAKKSGKSWAQGLVNAILREYLRHQKEIDDVSAEPEAQYAHPDWWIEAIEKAWPEAWQAILEANNALPPFSLRVNQQHLSRENYLALLATKQISADRLPETECGVMLASPLSVEQLPGFTTGDVSVQDGAAQLAAELFDLKKGLRVLDACAAPGGKLTHLLEKEPDLTLIAIEKEAKRIVSIRENLLRLKLNAQCICADAAHTTQWWDGIHFDRILLDAPCSASGVVRRHPDIKLLRLPEDIPVLAKTQLHLLQTLWPLLKPGGILVYATCSIFPEENTEVATQFLAMHPEAVEEKLIVSWGLPCIVGRQILPGMHHMDGFYYARFKKKEKI
ncbi:MAG: 16S rRNA (cytosine(967)-C(5))-methyltransferase RsmB [Gammaproteobacteria bacterium]|nr:16S rRNA (cytosine(967)-C(5))-methyltransferase RsmB [Gammaproteobacteria bacterium]